jgi:hypothetical protein
MTTKDEARALWAREESHAALSKQAKPYLYAVIDRAENDDVARIPRDGRKLDVSSHGVLAEFVKQLQWRQESPYSMLFGYEITFSDDLPENTFK